jgi:hypothetical protein
MRTSSDIMILMNTGATGVDSDWLRGFFLDVEDGERCVISECGQFDHCNYAPRPQEAPVKKTA